MQSSGTNSTVDILPGATTPAAASAMLGSSNETSETPPVGETANRGRIEVWRKVLHMTPGLLPFTLVLLEHTDPIHPVTLFTVALIAGLLTWVYIRSARFVKRDGEDDFILTAVSYPALVVLSLAIFPGHAEFACVVAVILAFGDGSAYLAGKLLGKRKLPWNPDKTWMGTCAFVICSTPIAAAAYWLEARPEVPMAMAAVCAFTAAFLAAIAESLPMRVNDNLRVGIASIVGVSLAYFFVVDRFLTLS